MVRRALALALLVLAFLLLDAACAGASPAPLRGVALSSASGAPAAAAAVPGAALDRGATAGPTRAVLRWRLLLWQRLTVWHRRFGLRPTLRDLQTGLYIMYRESSGNPLCVTGRFWGLYQFDAYTWGRGLNLFSPLTNVSLFCKATARNERHHRWQYRPWPWYHGWLPLSWRHIHVPGYSP